MPDVVLLDAGPMGMVAHPRPAPKCSAANASSTAPRLPSSPGIFTLKPACSNSQTGSQISLYSLSVVLNFVAVNARKLPAKLAASGRQLGRQLLASFPDRA